MASKSTQVQVSLGDRSYPIFIGSDEIRRADIASYISGKKVLIVTNETIAPLYLESLKRQLTDKQVDSVILADGEQYKNLGTLNLIFDQLIGNHHDRKTTLIALGGGVVGDMTGFAAACYQRGVPFIQIPTTLLAQVDSSVGGKTAVNHAMGKNMIGAFYQPQAVIIDTDTLSTLPDREFYAGLAEVIKYGLIADADFFRWLESNVDLLLQRDKQALAYAIELSCVCKARIVAEDETEQGIRAILNLGHTFGHAIETFQNYKQWIHGEAVAAGMVMAAQLSVISGDLPEADLQRTKALLQHCSLPVAPPADMTAEDFTQLMLRDKKVLDGQLRLVLLKCLGEACVTDQFAVDHLNQVLIKACTAN
ncbi:3-dehydroquinate synthase [Porticoccaceae bacterium]|nr:3-dehydroquinate synthase [Porticoccaceae bacterium]MDA9983682.1 3-dehydroquinate synthase [Porticoccaceae bacterium]MDB9969521.1 3-dehydroquinate synthase [Porticoccaceae bacterium]MDC0011358.1 3-dehydroquinate synthase [Porticoccaceae bacterium]MDC1453484.1 3-dehydroquinate synthase [Porticoccaceae bacterium]